MRVGATAARHDPDSHCRLWWGEMRGNSKQGDTSWTSNRDVKMCMIAKKTRIAASLKPMLTILGETSPIEIEFPKHTLQKFRRNA